MELDILPREEKKVEYLELIYDLIFVYVIGRNNSLLHHVEKGFVSLPTFLAFILCSLAVIQIWSFSTFYINMYGRNGTRDHVSLFLNMYLLYYIGEGTRLHWESFHTQYHLAWALILVNLGAQYAIELKNHPDAPEEQRTIRRMALVLLGEAALVLLCIPVYSGAGISLSLLPILAGVLLTWRSADEAKTERIDFAHLSERAMLYVVFTFGEMIIAIASYFEGEFSFNAVYFSTMCFLIVVGLFLSYEVFYNRIVDRTQRSAGLVYMLVHILLILSLNSITISLEFMRDEAVALWPKTLFLIGALLLYFGCLVALQLFAKPRLRPHRGCVLPLLGLTGLFVALMLLLRENMRINILVSALYVFAMFLLFYRLGRRGAQAPNAGITG